MIYTLNKLVTINSKYGDQENGTMKSKMLFNYRNVLSDDETILKSFVTIQENNILGLWLRHYQNAWPYINHIIKAI